MVTASGLGSGLDVKGIVTQLMTAESQPLIALQKKEAGYQNQITAYGQLKSALFSFQTALKGISSATERTSATSSDPSVLSVSATDAAVPGNHSVLVKSLAQGHKLGSASLESEQFDLGTGNLVISVGGRSITVELSGTDTTLYHLQQAINNASNNPGVTASLMNVDGATRLSLSSIRTGAENVMTISGSLANTLGFVEMQAAQDAEFVVDGFSAKNATNSASGIIPGVTLSALQLGETEKPVTVTISKDRTAVTDALRGFTQAYNGLAQVLTNLAGSTLKGDTTLRTIQTRINTMMSGRITTAGAYNYLSQMGIGFQKDGVLAFSSATFLRATNDDYESVLTFLNDEKSGFVKQMSDLLTGLLDGKEGVIQARTEGLTSRIKTLQTDGARLAKRLSQTEERYYKQFTTLDSLVANMQKTSSYLSHQMSSSSGS